MAALGQSRRFRDVGCESALPPRTDIVSQIDHVGFVPQPDLRPYPWARMQASPPTFATGVNPFELSL
jgi:hypothetical protein